jgi:hypothetical protein
MLEMGSYEKDCYFEIGNGGPILFRFSGKAKNLTKAIKSAILYQEMIKNKNADAQAKQSATIG